MTIRAYVPAGRFTAAIRTPDLPGFREALLAYMRELTNLKPHTTGVGADRPRPADG